MTTSVQPSRTPVDVAALLRAAHIGPAAAVTAVVALLAVGQHLPPGRAVLVTAAVLAGQLTIGWGNDLRDAARDREVGRTDKPLATGELAPSLVLACLVVAGLACLALSASVGWRSALLNVVLGAGGGHAYNLALKSTAWSWAPYAVTFGTLPSVVTMADVPHRWAPVWMMVAAGALGVAAHFLNVLPDLAADDATGVRGLPHRLGDGGSRAAAIALLLAASAAAGLGPSGAPSPTTWVAWVLVAALAVVAGRGRGATPFHAAIAIALVDVALLTIGAT